MATEIHSIKVRFISLDGIHMNEIYTMINGTKEEITNYYMNNIFDFGDTPEHPADLPMKAVKVSFLKEGNA